MSSSSFAGSGRPRAGLALVALGIVVAVAAKGTRKRARRALDVYMEEVSSGSRPIEAVGTAVAAFVGLPPG